MNFKKTSFKVVENRNCPFYQQGDLITVFGRSVSLQGKPTCLTLMSDITETLVNHQKLDKSKTADNYKHEFSCSGYQTGCPGTIRLRYISGNAQAEPSKGTIDRDISPIIDELKNFSIFKTLNEHDFKEIVSYFKIKTFSKNQIILRKGDRGENLHVILSGKVNIIGNYGITVASLSKGEIFGEMSLLTGNPVSSKVKVIENTKTMYMPGSYFRMMLNRFAPLQIYFSRLLAQRLAKSNLERAKEFSSGISGNLTEISTTELLQTLNLAQKHGVLTLILPKGNARISLRAGEPVNVTYNGLTGAEAFFEIVRHKRGNFKFKAGLSPAEMDAPVIGDFMYLLMEGMNRIDEESQQPIILDP